MKTIEEFVEHFTKEKIVYEVRGSEAFTPTDTPKISAPLLYSGERLGFMKKGSFTPSFALLDWIGSRTTKKIVVNEKSAWLFVCGKNILKEGILLRKAEEGIVLIVNEHDEVLGYGKITGAGVTNLLDRGDYLRRE